MITRVRRGRGGPLDRGGLLDRGRLLDRGGPDGELAWPRADGQVRLAPGDGQLRRAPAGGQIRRAPGDGQLRRAPAGGQIRRAPGDGQMRPPPGDGQVRRALASGLAGAGASALVEAQAAVLHCRGGPRRDLARALAVNADVLAGYGDPDLAVASADLAIRLFLRGRRAAADREELRRALAVAVAVHRAHGRYGLAEQAVAVARRIGGLVGPAPTVLEARRPALDVTVAAALDRLDRSAPLVGNRPIVRPPVELELVVPLDRVGTGKRSGDAAARVGRALAGLAIEALPVDGAAGGRLGMEAHAMLAGAARLGSELLTEQLAAFGPPWAAALLACARRAEADRDHALALDLATRAAGVAEQLFPATLVDRDAAAVAAEAVELVTALRSPPR